MQVALRRLDVGLQRRDVGRQRTGVEGRVATACRQVIAEFGRNAVIWYQGKSGIVESTMERLLPDSFSL